METKVSKFKATILSEVGKVITSSDLEHRVLIVRDEDSRVKVSAQVWLKNGVGEYEPGRGYFLTGRRAVELAKAIDGVLDYEENKGVLDLDTTKDIQITNTQKYIITNKSDINVLFVDKWWRKSEEDEWTFGKSVAIATEKAGELSTLLRKAGYSIMHVK